MTSKKIKEVIEKEWKKRKTYTFKGLCEMLYFAELVGEMKGKPGSMISAKALEKRWRKPGFHRMLALMEKAGIIFYPKKGFVEVI